ncbi:unnamed protein product [Didymodactylos carnosus]|uniref:Asl1-like glycosyl hydrolase catalytic domain-containing protein n=1 Tax=Didymodactylos carnosus TaxID=1234261 RepID=A0A815C6Y5_9BILA|nr:unnamed protein product [Didymodactylos carnosus]CAF1309159.1 unnamed protein product [Didymodactylos carnosus]CAF4074743.1 unnamed protein product [Didymodactylos carnosus]CAF4116807.1 unnamed protein product [Didymodactylos carnosus]
MQRTDSKIADLANGVATSGCKTVLGFNEPDHAEQAHMSPSQAVTLWKQHIQPLKNKGIALGAPAVSSGPSAIHWYGTSITEFKSYVEKVHNIYPSKPIWVTEFACISPASLSEVSAFLEKAMPWLDSQSYVAKYSWFGAMPQNLVNSYVGQNAALMDNNGQLTSLGKLYAS